MTGYGADLWVTYPRAREVYVKKISSPATSTDNIGGGWQIETDPGVGKRATLVATEKELFVFTRTSRSKEGNLRFFRYDHGGELLSSGYVEQMDKDNIRIGATLDSAGHPVVVVWSGSANAASLRYYRWNGTGFDKPGDSLVWDLSDKHRCDRGERTREYAFAVTDDDTLHLTWTCSRREVIHGHKQMGAKGHWKYTRLAKHKGQREYDFNTTLTTQGNQVHAFYTLDTKKAGANLYYSRWDPKAESWLDPVQLTDTGDAAVPNTVWKLNPDAKQIPYAYWEGSAAVVTGRVTLP